MSTRCQVKIQGTDVNGSAAFTLYHHCDGYPSYMLPLIASGYKDVWQAARAGKAASMLCAADPTGFELEQGHDLHGDIEYYYVVNTTSGGWTVTAYSVGYEGDMAAICTDMPVAEAAKQAEAIES